MTDEEFLGAFETGELTEFHHRDHLRLAWLRVREFGDGAEAVVGNDIRTLAARHQAHRKYHQTVTTFWVRLVRHADALHAPPSFDQLLVSCPLLLDQGAPLRHWSAAELWSDSARAGWREPDLRPVP